MEPLDPNTDPNTSHTPEPEAVQIPVMPTPASVPAEPSAPAGRSGLHTYAGDMAQTLRDQKGSMIKIAIAEQNKREQIAEDISPQSGKNKFYMFGGAVLLLIGIALAVFISISRSTSVETVETQKAPSLILADSQKEINTTTLTLDKVFISIQNEIQSSTIKLDTIEQIYLTRSIVGSKEILNTKDLFALLNSSAPQRLLRSLGDTFMLGVHAYNGNQAFLLFTMTSREDTFAGMLAWETKMFDDLYQVFGIDVSGDKNYLFSSKFEDAVIKNKDARVIRDKNGKIVLMYLFPTDNTLIITNGENALQEAFNRLQNLKTLK